MYRRKNPNKYEALNRRITEPRVTATREFKVLKALQKRIVQDMQQSEIIVIISRTNTGMNPRRSGLSFLKFDLLDDLLDKPNWLVKWTKIVMIFYSVKCLKL